VIVRPASAPVFSDPSAAHGLLIAGEGATVGRRTALASLLNGEVANAVVNGGLPGGRPKISLSSEPAATTFYVALPPPGRHHNVVRYPIAVIGPGYHGLLTSTSTHLTGLIPISDVAPSVLALQQGKRPRIRSRPSSEPLAYLRDFDRRLTQAHDSRTGGLLVLVGLIVALGLAALFTRAPGSRSRSAWSRCLRSSSPPSGPSRAGTASPRSAPGRTAAGASTGSTTRSRRSSSRPRSCSARSRARWHYRPSRWSLPPASA
jgi:hypothetical protein